MIKRTEKNTELRRSLLHIRGEILKLVLKHCGLNNPRMIRIHFNTFYSWFESKITNYDWYSLNDTSIRVYEGEAAVQSDIKQEGRSASQFSNHELLLQCLTLAIEQYGKQSPRIVIEYAEKYLEILDTEDSNTMIESQRVSQFDYKEDSTSASEVDEVTKTTIDATVRRSVNRSL